MNILKTTFAAENQYWLKNTLKKDFFVYFELQAEKFESNTKRIPLNISLVIDRSGSMAGDKLTFVKKAVNFVIDNLSNDDILSIVQYDSVVEIVSNSAKVTNKADLHHKVNQIVERNSTNLSGGMLEGFTQVQSTQKSGYVNRVLLLSDGLANEGITEPTQLQNIVQKKFREQGIALSTFGVGADFNEELMRNLSEYGGGNYYFIETPDKIPQIFAEELSGLLSVVAQNTKLDILFPQEHFKCTKVYGYPALMKSNEVNINFNDVFSEEKKAVLVKFELSKDFEKLGFDAKLSYDDVVKRLEKVNESLSVTLSATTDENLFGANVNRQVVEQIVSFVGNDMFEAAVLKADNRDFETAKSMIAQVKMYLDAHFKVFPATEELKKLYQNILDYESRLEGMENMSGEDYFISQKISKMASYSHKRKK